MTSILHYDIMTENIFSNALKELFYPFPSLRELPFGARQYEHRVKASFPSRAAEVSVSRYGLSR